MKKIIKTIMFTFLTALLTISLVACNKKKDDNNLLDSYITSGMLEEKENGKYQGSVSLSSYEVTIKDIKNENFTLEAFKEEGEGIKIAQFNVSKVDDKNLTIEFTYNLDGNAEDYSYILKSTKACTNDDKGISALLSISVVNIWFTGETLGMYEGSTYAEAYVEFGGRGEFVEEISSHDFEVEGLFEDAKLTVEYRTKKAVLLKFEDIESSSSVNYIIVNVLPSAIKDYNGEAITLTIDYLHPSIEFTSKDMRFSGNTVTVTGTVKDGFTMENNSVTVKSGEGVTVQESTFKDNKLTLTIVCDTEKYDEVFENTVFTTKLYSYNEDEIDYDFEIGSPYSTIDVSIKENDSKTKKVTFQIKARNAEFDKDVTISDIKIESNELKNIKIDEVRGNIITLSADCDFSGVTDYIKVTILDDSLVIPYVNISSLESGTEYTFSEQNKEYDPDKEWKEYKKWYFMKERQGLLEPWEMEKGDSKQVKDEKIEEILTACKSVVSGLGKTVLKTTTDLVKSRLKSALIGYVLNPIIDMGINEVYSLLGIKKEDSPHVMSEDTRFLLDAISGLSKQIDDVTDQITELGNNQILARYDELYNSLYIDISKIATSKAMVELTDMMKSEFSYKGYNTFEKFKEFFTEYGLEIYDTEEKKLKLYNMIVRNYGVDSGRGFDAFETSYDSYFKFSLESVVGTTTLYSLIRSEDAVILDLESYRNANQEYLKPIKEFVELVDRTDDHFEQALYNYGEILLKSSAGTKNGALKTYFDCIDRTYNFESETLEAKEAFLSRAILVYNTAYSIALQYLDADTALNSKADNFTVMKLLVEQAEKVDKLASSLQKELDNAHLRVYKKKDVILLTGQVVDKVVSWDYENIGYGADNSTERHFKDTAIKISSETLTKMNERAKALNMNIIDEMVAAGFKNVYANQDGNYYFYAGNVREDYFHITNVSVLLSLIVTKQNIPEYWDTYMDVVKISKDMKIELIKDTHIQKKGLWDTNGKREVNDILVLHFHK